MTTTHPTFIDLFAGIGGIRLAFDQSGFKCVFSSEWDQKCQKVYHANFHEIPQGDITKIKSSDIPSHDVLCAGFPCQPFSISGKQKGLTDERSNVLFELFRIIKDKKPKVVLLENVKHLIHLKDKSIFKFILKSLEDLGYNVSWSVLNASNFEIPQNRDRVIVVASKKKFDFDKINSKISKPLSFFLDKKASKADFLDSGAFTLIPKSQRHRTDKGLIFVGYRKKKIRTTGVRPNTKHLSRVHKMPNRIYSSDGFHPTIQSQESARRFWIRHKNKVRKLTLNECYKIMGFPPKFSRAPESGTQILQLGNSVPVPMIESVANGIRRQLL